ncbi:Zinc finger protein [Pseudolycoriella hygida]|uniref:Zinc finger protein n=1 Tax=Pseudolycoriella hygida TaxID=35572 RepID=A0A9Q0S183_9DIPT|nr:Zinc finger protein [Pseudolycoriella hygida]
MLTPCLNVVQINNVSMERIPKRHEIEVMDTEKPMKTSGTKSVKLRKLSIRLMRIRHEKTLLRSSKNKDNKKVYNCVLCDEKFDDHHLMIEHFRKHGERRQTGPLLPPQIKTKDRSSDLIKCEWCTEVFVTISKAIEHKSRKHRYESTNYFCKECGKLFPIKVALEQHRQVEHNSRKAPPKAEDSSCLFMCKFCSVSFSTLAAVNFHENGAHQIERRLKDDVVLPPASKKVKVNNQGEVTTLYYCHLCGNEYMVKYNLKKHLNVCHTMEEKTTYPTEGIIKCRACDAIFYNHKAYNVHNINHKPDDLYVTSEEQRQKIVARVDQDFDFTRVPTLAVNTCGDSKANHPSLSELKPVSLNKLIPISKPQWPMSTMKSSKISHVNGMTEK